MFNFGVMSFAPGCRCYEKGRDAYAAGLIEQSEFEGHIGPLRAKHDRENAALASQRGDLAEAINPAAATKALAALADQVDQNLKSASFDLKRELLTLLIKRIEIHREEIKTVYKVPCSPFVRSPDNRGKLQHRLSPAAIASR